MKRVKFLALSGSLRAASYNCAALKTLAKIAPDYIDIQIGDIGELPLFNPDLETSPIPALDKLKLTLKLSSGLIIASPEYAHGISAPMKNTLDWLVSSFEFPNIPIMLINTSPRAHHAMEALKEVLTTMSGKIIDEAEVSIHLLGSPLKDGFIEEENHAALLEALVIFYRATVNMKQRAL